MIVEEKICHFDLLLLLLSSERECVCLEWLLLWREDIRSGYIVKMMLRKCFLPTLHRNCQRSLCLRYMSVDNKNGVKKSPVYTRTGDKGTSMVKYRI